MKRIIAILLVLAMAFAVAACNDTGKDPAGSNKPSDNGGNNDKEEEVNIVFAENGKAKLYIVVPETLTTGANQARTLIKQVIKEEIGVTLMSGTMSDCEYEIHLGNTGDEAAAIIAELKEDEFAIKTVDKKIYIVAYNDLYLYDVAEYFLEYYLEDDKYFEMDEKSLVLKKAINDVDKTETDTLRYFLASGGDLTASVEEVVKVKNDHYAGESGTVPYRRQGGCFSGTAVYQSLITSKASNEKYGRIMKKDLKTGETTYSELRTDMGHMNAMTYNFKTDEVLVANGTSILIFDADTLVYKKTVKISTGASSGIAYDPIGNRFIAGYFTYYKGDLSAATGKKFSHTEEIANKISTDAYNALQGTATDGYFVVSLLAKSGAGPNGGYNCHVAVYDMEGNYLGLIKVTVPNGAEPENVSIIDGVIYVGVATPQPNVTLYKVVPNFVD